MMHASKISLIVWKTLIITLSVGIIVGISLSPISLFVANTTGDISWYQGKDPWIQTMHPILYMIEQGNLSGARSRIDQALLTGSGDIGSLYELRGDITYRYDHDASGALASYLLARETRSTPVLIQKIQYLQTLSAQPTSENHTGTTQSGALDQTGAIEIKKRIAEIEQYQQDRDGSINLSVMNESEQSKSIQNLLQDLQGDVRREIHDW